MDKALMRFKRWLRDWLAEAPAATPQGYLYHNTPRGIRGAATYDQPLTIPRKVTRRGAAAVASFIESTARDTYKFQFDTPQRGDADLPIQPVTEDPLEEWDAATREDVIANCHTAYDRDPLAKAAVDLTTSFVVGEGFRPTYMNEEVSKVLEAFINSDDTPVREYERQLLKDLLIDGELMLRFYETGGETVMVPVRPWEITEIEVEKGFIRRPTRYKWQYDGFANNASPSQPRGEKSEEWIDAAQMRHVAINRRSYELRGKSNLYVMLPWLRAYKEWLEDRARQNYWRGALLFHVQVDTASAATLAAVAARYATPPTPGSVAVTSAKEVITPVTNTSAAGEVAEDGRQLKLMAAVGAKMPEYMLSDGENANLASTSSQELPALTQFSEFQRIMIEQVWRPALKRVLENAMQAGVLPEEVEMQDSDWQSTGDGMVPTLEAFDLTYEPLAQENPLIVAQALQIAHDANWVSARTAATEMGYDYTKELKLMDDELEAQRDKIAAGLVPPPPGMNPDGTPITPDQQNPDERGDNVPPQEKAA